MALCVRRRGAGRTGSLGGLRVSPETLEGREEGTAGDAHAEETRTALGVLAEVGRRDREGGRVDDRLAPEDEEEQTHADPAAGECRSKGEDRAHDAVDDEDERRREELEKSGRGDTLCREGECVSSSGQAGRKTGKPR